MTSFRSLSAQNIAECIPFLPRLPKEDRYLRSRKKDLKNRQAAYQYNFDYVSPLALCKDVPFRDEFSIKWMWEISERLFSVLNNLLEVESDPYLRDRHHKNLNLFQGLKRAATFDVEGMIKMIQEAVEMGGAITHAESIEEYATMFRTIGLPPIHRDYRRDDVFADMRLAGPNPVMLRRVVDHLPENFPVTEAHFQAAMKYAAIGKVAMKRGRPDSLQRALADGRLYVCDYQLLQQLEKSDFPVEKFLYAPLALFVFNADERFLPVAIQCKQTPADDNPIFTPGDGYNWRIAKTIVGMADGNVHEPLTHLGHTHLFLEPFAMATARQLASCHPLGLLLRPHFEGTLHINNLAQKYLIAENGGVHRLCSGTIQSMRQVAVHGVQSHSFNDNMLPKTFTQRGVDDTQRLASYPYRDDALLYWHAIHDWAEEFISIYYHSDSDVQTDVELQNWHEEIVNVGKVKDFGEQGKIFTVNYLIDAVTMIIYTASVQHAAVNFPQYDLMSYAIAMPLAVYGEAPKTKTGATEQDYLDVLPPLELANLQMCLGYGLGTLHYTQLADYSRIHFRDLRVLRPLRNFQHRVKEIGDIIAERNKRRRPYKFLLPEGIPQSINI
jgi:arachidonate 15-lipoxygenase